MKHKNFAYFAPLGTLFAARTVHVVLAVGSCACLVTEKIEFEDTASPATVTPQRPRSFTRVLPNPMASCTGVEFSVRVSDANVTEELEARLVVNGERIDGLNIAPNGRADRGELLMCAPARDLDHPCSRVEVLVSSDFDAQNFPYGTTDPNDLAKAEWWVLGYVGTYPQVGPEACTSLFDGGVP